MPVFVGLLALALAAHAGQGFEHFITRDSNRLMEGDREFRFMGANMPGLVLPYDFTLRLPERMSLPTAWEQEDAFKTLDRMNLRVVRTWNLPMRGPKEEPQPWHYVLGPGQFNEEAFKTLDRVLALAHQYRVRVMPDLTADYGDYLGGIGTYSAHRGKKRADFYTDPQLREDYKATVRHVLGRVNTITGVPYKEDKAILAWQFGNEMMGANTNWLSEMAAYMKRLDPNHLVAETRHRPGVVPLIDPNIDLLTRHYYTSYAGLGKGWTDALRAEVESVKGLRPFFVGEYGPYVDGKIFTRENVAAKHKAFLDFCVSTPGVSGALLWSMYFHHRDGGYYWHQIYTFPSVWSYHFPGSPSGDAHGEIDIVQGLREAAFRIQGLPVPPLQAPEAPELLPFEQVPLFAWRGSAGAQDYDVERSASPEGPWELIAEQISDGEVAYGPLFSDETAKAGETWCYRISARNAGGRSAPSNVIGPIRLTGICFVDEFADFSRVASRSDGLTLDNTYNAWFAEKLFRVKGNASDWLSFRVRGVISTIKVSAFFPHDHVLDPAFILSAEGKAGVESVSQRSERPLPAIPKGDAKKRQMWVEYTLDAPRDARSLKIVWRGPMALDRVEIHHSGR